MKSNPKLCILGFSDSVTDELVLDIMRSGLTLSVEWVKKRNVTSPLNLGADFQFDITILNSDGFSDEAHELVNKIKTFSPLTEIILVAENENYKMAIDCFRGGVRDIIPSPIRSPDLKISLKNALIHHSLYQRSNILSQVLSFLNQFGDLRQFTTKENIYASLFRYLNESLGAKALVVNRVLGKTLEVTWQIHGTYLYPDETLVERVSLSYKPESLFELNQAKKGKLLSFYFGSSNGENYLAHLPLSDEQADKFETNFSDHFFRVLRNIFEQNEISTINKLYASLSMTDDVTGLHNQRKLSQDLDHYINRCERFKEEFSVVFIDIDHFKNVNDEFGHIIGSRLLIEVANEIRKVVRDTDAVYRYGGDEFVVIFPNSPFSKSYEIATRVLNKIKETIFLADEGKSHHLSVSMGVAHFPTDASTKDEIINMADRMMYSAKKSGRGKICTVNELFQKT
ncbi:MAG: diguanylate cyclase [Bacteriovoracaceae bacterium]